MVLPHRRRGDRHPDGGRRHRLRRLVGRLLLRRSTSRPGSCALEVPARARRTRSRPTPGEQPARRHLRRRARHLLGLVRARATARRPALVIFGGGYTLYALNAATGALYWRHDYTGRPASRPIPTRRHPHLLVAGGRRRQGALRGGRRRPEELTGLRRGRQPRHRRPGVGVPDRRRRRGTGAQRRVRQRVVVGHGAARLGPRRVRHRRLRLLERPRRWRRPSSPCTSTTGTWPGRTGRTLPRLHCDWDFGATANAGLDAPGQRHVPRRRRQGRDLLLARPGHRPLRWATNVVFGGFSGGFIATDRLRRPAGLRLDRPRRLRPLREARPGACATRRTPATRRRRSRRCTPSTPPPGAVAWQADHGRLVRSHHRGRRHDLQRAGPQRATCIQVRDAATGQLIAQLALPQSNWSGIATVGDALVFGTGSTYRGDPAGIEVLTPGGAPAGALVSRPMR